MRQSSARRANHDLCHRRRRLYRFSHLCRVAQRGAGGDRVRQLLRQPARGAGACCAHHGPRMPTLVQDDVRDRAALTAALSGSGAKAVIHFAGLKAVGDSVQDPLAYYDNNVAGAMPAAGNGHVRYQNAGFQFIGYCLWHSAVVALYRRPPARKYQPPTVRPSLSSMRCCATCTAVMRPDWRRSAGHAQQPAALCRAGGGRAARVLKCLVQRLRHAGWHRRARLHPCG